MRKIPHFETARPHPELAAEAARVQGSAVSATQESARRWSGYVCPDCRFVFRVPRDHDGKGLICPSCRRLLRIPGPEDVPPPLLAPLRAVETPRHDASDPEARPPESEESDGTRRVRRRRKKSRSKGLDGTPSWESAQRRRRGESLPLSWWLGGGSVLMLGCVAALWWAFSHEPETITPQTTASRPANAPPADSPAAEITELPEVMRRGESAVREEAEPLARTFLEARHIDEILPLVRHPERVRTRLLRDHPDGTVEPRGMTRFHDTVGASYHGNMVAFTIVTGDLDSTQLAFIDTPDGLKIDWESYYGWSDLPWETFLNEKPTQASSFRVILGPVEYYNFDFTDDRKWQSFRIESPDAEHQLYGYVERGSVLHERLRPAGDAKRMPMILELKFPPAAQGRNQVLIERLVTEGWVLEENGEPSSPP